MIKVEIVPMLHDNYGYVIETATGCVVVDPSEFAPIQSALAGRPLMQIWCTHQHTDHVGGVVDLVASHPTATVVGSAYDLERGRIPCQSVGVHDGDVIDAGSLRASVLAVPGHTLGAIAYLAEDALFTGDTLFLAGCGRLFEGSAEQMFASLQRLGELPAGTRIYCGHEYTAKNLAFAQTSEPDNLAVFARLTALRVPSVPGTIAAEHETNPFLRAASTGRFAELRRQKDAFS